MSQRMTAWIVLFMALIFTSAPHDGYALSAKDVYQKVNGSIYTLYSLSYDNKEVKARGSAVAVSEHVLATNCHVALAGDFLVVKMHKTKNKVGRLTYKNEKEDLCLVEVPNSKFKPVKLRYSSDVSIGEEVYAIGNPKGTEKTLSKGIISNKHKVSGGYYLQTDAAIYFGSSGGGLFDEQGQLVGITTKMGGRFGLAIPSEWIVQVVYPDHIKTASNDKEESASSKPNPDSEKKGLKRLGDYGEDKVALYQNNSECFLIMDGKNKSGDVKSTALWNPKYEKTLIIFPTAGSAKEAMKEVVKSYVEKTIKTQTTYRSKSMLTIGGNQYPLYGSKTEDGKYSFLVIKFKESPEPVLDHLSTFKAQFDDPDPRLGDYSVSFGLEGFNQALSAYKVDCL